MGEIVEGRIIEDMMEHEKKFLHMLGLSMIESFSSSKIDIVNSDGVIVGLIEKRKVYNQNKKKNLPAVFGYHTEVKSDTIIYDATRRLDTSHHNFQYEFKIKQGNEWSDAYLALGENVDFFLKNGQGRVEFSMNDDRMYLGMMGDILGIKKEETIVVGLRDTNKKYSYTCSNNEKEGNKEEGSYSATFDIEFVEDSGCSLDEKNISIKRKMWKDGEIVEVEESRMSGTIEGIISNDSLAKGEFHNFGTILNTIFRSEEDAMVQLLGERRLQIPEIRAFLSDINEKAEASQLFKVKKI